MRLDHVELVRVPMVLASPFGSAHSTVSTRDVLLLHAIAGGIEGWSEVGVLPEPGYSAETTDVAQEALVEVLLPRLRSGHDVASADVAQLFADLRGVRASVAAIEAVLLDLECRLAGTALADRIGALHHSVPAGVAVGLHDDIALTVAEVVGHVDRGYGRIKLKVVPGVEYDLVQAVRREIGDTVQLMVDANGSYDRAGASALAALDEFGLACIEQPFAPDDLDSHAMLAAAIETPICLDESITCLDDMRRGVELGACSVVNLKWSRVGGVLEAIRIHDECALTQTDLWIGGMLSTGVGKSVDLALAALPGVTMIGDLSESARYFDMDVTDEFVMNAGRIDVPHGPGIGVAPDAERLRRLGARVVSG